MGSVENSGDGTDVPSAQQEARFERLFTSYRDYVKHEDNLINNRTTWLMQIQGFLIATVGLSYQKDLEVVGRALMDCKEHLIHNERVWFAFFIAASASVGIVTSGIARFSVLAASRATQNLQEMWTHIANSNGLPIGKNDKLRGRGEPVVWESKWFLPDLTGGGLQQAVKSGLRLPSLLPDLFLVFWILLLAFTVAHALPPDWLPHWLAPTPADICAAPHAKLQILGSSSPQLPQKLYVFG